MAYRLACSKLGMISDAGGTFREILDETSNTFEAAETLHVAAVPRTKLM